MNENRASIHDLMIIEFGDKAVKTNRPPRTSPRTCHAANGSNRTLYRRAYVIGFS
jgi:hypothetical protein